ncbi:hypothetical protein Aperf_G00000082817 [Anoplocephala perfoliata]
MPNVSTSPFFGKPISKLSSSLGDNKPLPPITEDSSNETKGSIRFNLPPSLSSLSSLTSVSMNDNGKNFTAIHPSANLQFLRDIQKRSKRKRRLRKVARIFHCIFVYGLPIGGVNLGIVGLILGHFLHIEPLFVGSCLLLIATIGLILQSCFWKRSFPNKFRAKEIPFNMPQEDSLISKSNEQSEQDSDESPCESPNEQQPKSPGVNSAQVRKLSMALNRATAELSAARQISSVAGGGNGVLNLARRLTMGPMHFGDFGGLREHESGNGWIAGQFPQGVRRGLAWNDTGASRFYASNYD